MLNSKTIESIEQTVGLNYNDIISMDVDELNSIIEKKIGKELKYSLNDKRVPIRGSVYLFYNRFFNSVKKRS